MIYYIMKPKIVQEKIKTIFLPYNKDEFHSVEKVQPHQKYMLTVATFECIIYI